jgi:hypothetical protein
VLKLLRTVEYEDPTYNLNSKIMLMLTFYETQEFESLSSLLSSFDLYLRRKKEISSERKHLYMNLIKYLRALLRIGPGDSKALVKLRQQVNTTDEVVNKEWLLEKIDALL